MRVLGGNFTCTLHVGGINYGKFSISVLALFGAAYTLSFALKTPGEPTWLRWGRPGMLLAVGMLNLAAALVAVL
ncbi:MAG: hypothetical protein AAFX99_03280 [Myxococcota bacterium]